MGLGALDRVGLRRAQRPLADRDRGVEVAVVALPPRQGREHPGVGHPADRLEQVERPVEQRALPRPVARRLGDPARPEERLGHGDRVVVRSITRSRVALGDVDVAEAVADLAHRDRRGGGSSTPASLASCAARSRARLGGADVRLVAPGQPGGEQLGGRTRRARRRGGSGRRSARGTRRSGRRRRSRSTARRRGAAARGRGAAPSRRSRRGAGRA